MSIISYTAIYNADGGLVGEARYVLGHVFGLTECALCDVTHSPVRRKPEWDRMVARTAVPIRVLHRNEVAPELAVLLTGIALPIVIAHHDDGLVSQVLSVDELAALGGSVESFEVALREASPVFFHGKHS
ncbi:MAG: hypothetical protein LH471_12110 [Salinibacterium sp.]|nr:hypothetical protein [Salinibacterium sp.]